VPGDAGVPGDVGVPGDAGVPGDVGVPGDAGVPGDVGVPRDDGYAPRVAYTVVVITDVTKKNSSNKISAFPILANFCLYIYFSSLLYNLE
jgi:Collagen triple helix repeat (20 copies)